MKKIFFSLLAVLLLIEEWLWDILTALGQWLARILHLAKVENWLRRSSPPVALLAFAIPTLLVTPFHLVAFWLLAHGLVPQGLALEILAKLVGTLLVARIFALTKPQLLSYVLFARLYHAITGWLRWAHERIVQTAVYRLAKQAKARAKAWLATLRWAER